MPAPAGRGYSLNAGVATSRNVVPSIQMRLQDHSQLTRHGDQGLTPTAPLGYRKMQPLTYPVVLHRGL
jgi:hypothetical protein